MTTQPPANETDDVLPLLTTLSEAARESQRLSLQFYRRASYVVLICAVILASTILYDASVITQINNRGSRNETIQLCEATAESIIATDVHLLVKNNLHPARYIIPPVCQPNP